MSHVYCVGYFPLDVMLKPLEVKNRKTQEGIIELYFN